MINLVTYFYPVNYANHFPLISVVNFKMDAGRVPLDAFCGQRLYSRPYFLGKGVP